MMKFHNDTTPVSLPDFQVVGSVFVSLLTSPEHWWLHENFSDLLLYALTTKLKNVREKKGSGGDAIYKI